MKKTLLFVSLLMLSLSAHAAKMSCEIGTLYATAGGLMPKAENFKMSVDVNGFKEAQSQDAFGYRLTLSAGEGEYVGGFTAVLAVDTLGDLLGIGEQGHSVVDLVTLKKNRKLDIIKSETNYLDSVIGKLFDANIDYDFKDTGDSALMDESVKKAVKSNVLKEGEIMLFSIKDCQVSK